MATIGSLVVELRTNTAKFNQSMNHANKRLDGFRNTVSRATRVLGTFGVALGGAALARFGRNVIATTAALEDAARTAGIGVGRFQELTKAFSDLGGIAEKTTGEAFRRFNRRLGLAQQGSGEAAKTFEALGISLREGTGVALEETIQRLAGIQDAAARSAAASQVFGEDAGPRLAAVLGMGTRAIDDQVRRLREQGRVLGEDNVKAAGALDDTLGELADTMSTQLTRAVTDNADEFNRLAKTLQSESFSTALDVTVKFFTAIANEAARSAQQVGNLVDLFKGEFNGDSLLDNSMIGLARRSLGLGTFSDEEPGEKPGEKPKPQPIIPENTGTVLAKAGKSLDDFTNKLELHNRELRAELDGWSDVETQMQAVEEASKTLGRQLTQEETEAVRKLVEQRQNLSAAIEANNEALDEQQLHAEELGFTFSSAFEDAIVEGGKFRDLLKALEKDIIRIVTRRLITEPLSDGITEFVKGAFKGGGGIGGFFSSLFPAFASGTNFAPGGMALVGEQGPELVNLPRGSQVIPNHKMGMSVTNNVYVQAPSGRITPDSMSQLQATLTRATQRGTRNL